MPGSPSPTPQAPPLVECFYDCSSPWTYLAFHHLQALGRELGVPIQWRPVLVGGIFNAVNPSVYHFREHGVPAKQAYLRKDLQDWARHSGLAITFPPAVFPVNSVKAMRAALWLQPQGQLEAWSRAVFEAYWGRNQDISQDTVLAQIANSLGLDAQALAEAVAAPEVKAALKANTDEAVARGAFGSPTVFVEGLDMYFGNDRLPLVREAILRHMASSDNRKDNTGMDRHSAQERHA